MHSPFPHPAPFSLLSGFHYNERSKAGDKSSPVYYVLPLPQVPQIRKVQAMAAGEWFRVWTTEYRGGGASLDRYW